MTASHHTDSPDSADSPETPTLTAEQIVAHVRFSEAGIDKSSALMLLFFITGWLEHWNGRPILTDAAFEAWEHGPTDPHAHARFPQTFPRRLRTGEDPLLGLQVEAVLAWARGGRAGQHGPLRSTALITAAKQTSAYAEAAATGQPAFASGPVIPPELLRASFAELAAAVEAGTSAGPVRPGDEELAAAQQKDEARRLREQLAERFDSGPGITEIRG